MCVVSKGIGNLFICGMKYGQIEEGGGISINKNNWDQHWNLIVCECVAWNG